MKKIRLIPFYMFLLFYSLFCSASNWHIGKITSTRHGEWYRVSCYIVDQEIWFESPLPLNPTGEAFANLLILPALEMGKDIYLDFPVDRQWFENVQKLISVYHEWWGTPLRNPFIVTSFRNNEKKRLNKVGSCFSCGVDSYHTLLCENYPIDFLVCVHGLDIPLADEIKFSTLSEEIKKICRILNKQPLFIRTNVRNHPVISSLDWGEKMCGPVLGAIGLLSSFHIGQLVIPGSSGNTIRKDFRWGSHWRTDPFHSSSFSEIIHPEEADKIDRRLKIALISTHPLVKENLRVCWEGRNSWNCSQCTKCVYTMVDLCASNALEDFHQVFDLSIPLIKRIDGLERISTESFFFHYYSIQQQDLPDNIQSSLQKLMGRSLQKISQEIR